jgi:molybdopterin synthase sulfur carrier subunit
LKGYITLLPLKQVAALYGFPKHQSEDDALRVELKLCASLARFAPKKPGKEGTVLMEIPEGKTIGEMLSGLKVPLTSVKLVFLNGVHSDMNQALREGDRVGVFPPVAGG